MGLVIAIALGACGDRPVETVSLQAAAQAQVRDAANIQRELERQQFVRDFLAKADKDAAEQAAAWRTEQRAIRQRQLDAQRVAARATRSAAPRQRITPAPTVVQAPAVATGDMRSLILACIRSYEGAYSTNTGNGFYGAYQFTLETWGGERGPDGLRHAGAVTRAGFGEFANTLPSDAPPHVQDAAAWQLYQERGLQPWPTPNRMCHPPNPRPKR